MLDRHDPFGRTLGLRRIMDRLLEDAVVMPRGEDQGGGPPLDAYEEGDTLVVEAHLHPGALLLDRHGQQPDLFDRDGAADRTHED